MGSSPRHSNCTHPESIAESGSTDTAGREPARLRISTRKTSMPSGDDTTHQASGSVRYTGIHISKQLVKALIQYMPVLTYVCLNVHSTSAILYASRRRLRAANPAYYHTTPGRRLRVMVSQICVTLTCHPENAAGMTGRLTCIIYSRVCSA